MFKLKIRIDSNSEKKGLEAVDECYRLGLIPTAELSINSVMPWVVELSEGDARLLYDLFHHNSSAAITIPLEMLMPTEVSFDTTHRLRPVNISAPRAVQMALALRRR